MTYFLLGLVTLALILLGARAFAYANPRQLAQLMRKTGGIVAILLALALALTGRALLAVPLAFFGAMLLLRGSPLGSPASATKSPGRVSSVRTAFLEMVLDHDTGAMNGRVLAGVFAGRELASLAQPDLIVLWQECRAAEPQSRQLLEAYLDRIWQDWRDAARRAHPNGPAGGARRDGAGERPAGTASRLTREEAYEVLGLAPGAGEEEIKAAHRNLMKRFHPDQGGSTYIAAKINEAKAVLLGK